MERTIRRNFIIWGVVTAVLLIGMSVGWYVALIRPQKEAIVTTEKKYTERRGVADQLPAALSDQAKAEQNLRYVQGQLAFLRHRYRSLYFDFGRETDTPFAKADSADVRDYKKNVTWRRWLNEYYSGYGLALRQELIDAANDSGVLINTTFSVVAPPKAPEEVVPPSNGFFKPTGGALNLEVTGTLPAIMQFLKRLNSLSSNILLLVGSNIKLEGTSPEVKATFTVTPYLLATGEPVTLEGVTRGAVAAAPGAPGGGPGGGPPGGPGGRPGGAAP